MSDLLTWRDGPIAAGPAVVVDLDGTLSDASAREHHVRASPKNWDAFFAACGDDPLVDHIARLVELLDPELVVILLTARPTKVRKATLGWLERHGVRWDLLVMRAPGDFRPSPDAKLDAVRALRNAGFDLRLAIDDDARNVALFRSEGIPCIELRPERPRS